jgi:hypothetical protein
LLIAGLIADVLISDFRCADDRWEWGSVAAGLREKDRNRKENISE